VVKHPCGRQPFSEAGHGGVAVSTFLPWMQTLLQPSSSAGTPAVPPQFSGGGWGSEWDTRSRGTTPAVPARSPGASLGRASPPLLPTPSIVLGGSLRSPGTTSRQDLSPALLVGAECLPASSRHPCRCRAGGSAAALGAFPSTAAITLPSAFSASAPGLPGPGKTGNLGTAGSSPC